MELQEKITTDNSVFHAVSDSDRRLVLQLLDDRNSAVPIRELATHLVAEQQDKPLIDVPPDEVESIHVDLVHTHLSKLEAADLVTWNSRERTVTTTNHPALSDPKLQRMLRVQAEGWDEVLATPASTRRRIVLSVLKDTNGRMSRANLAKAVVACDQDGGAENELMEAAEEFLVELHHVHLPKLERAGLVSYDQETGTAEYEGHPALEDE